MQVRNLLLLGFLAFVFTACAKQVRVISPEESATLGFNVSGKSVLENPPENKARIYVVREAKTFASGLEYPVYYLYDSPNMYKDEKGAFRIKDEVRKEIAEKSKNNFMGLLSNGAKLFEDFEADKPLLFRFTQKKSFGQWAGQLMYAPIIILPLALPYYWTLPDEEDIAFLLFTPKAGKIYCFVPLKFEVMGNSGAYRFYSNENLFVDRQACENLFR